VYEPLQLEPLLTQKVFDVVVDAGYLDLVWKQVAKPVNLLALLF